MNITLHDIIRIFNKIARTYPKSGCGGIRGFATINDGSVFRNVSNAGKRYEDYVAGRFWAYDWEKGGANSDVLCLEYPALGVEWKVGRIPNLNEDRMCYDFTILLCDHFDCNDCQNGCNRSRDEVLHDINTTLFNVIREFYTYGLYECTEKMEGQYVTYYSWMGIGEFEWMRENCPEVKCKPKCKSLRHLFKDFQVQFQEWEDMNKAGYVADFTLCGCTDEKPPFDYSTDEPTRKVGVTECSSCG